MKLYAISDLHLDYRTNMQALAELPSFKDDWLITGGDLCTRLDHLRNTLKILTYKFAKVFWVPGNHELWTSPPLKDSTDPPLGGDLKYRTMVDICRQYGVHTPEDPFVAFPDDDKHVIAPLFIPYDYSFAPPEITPDKAIEWAMESGILCRDEKLIETTPYDSMIQWCQARLEYSQARLEEHRDRALVLVNHFPLRQDLVRLWRIPRFSIWCGTKSTEDWHTRFKPSVVVSGHLHMRATDFRDNVRFEEVSLGYPRDWDNTRGMAYYLREILPGPIRQKEAGDGPFWRMG